MTKRHSFRLIDSGVRNGRMQIAYDAALTELHGAGRAPNTVRFMRFPPTVLIGRHQVMASEVHVERCRAEGVGLVRRVSGGGAIYLDEGQVGWELVFHRSLWPGRTLGDYANAICNAVAAGLSERFGIAARFRPRNDIEVDGRKLSGTGGYFDGDTLVYQGTVLIDMDASRMARLLNIPASKLARHGSEQATARVVTLSELLGEPPSVDAVHAAILAGLSSELGIEATSATASDEEVALTRRLHDEEIGTDAFVFGEAALARLAHPSEAIHAAERQCQGGTVKAFLRLEGSGKSRRIREALITGDFFIAPPRTIYDLEAHLRGTALGDVGASIDGFFARTDVGLMTLSPEDIREAIVLASEQQSGDPRV